MRPSHATLLLASLALLPSEGCKKQSALESISADLPEGEATLEAEEVRAHILRENAKERKNNRTPGENQVGTPAPAPTDAGTAKEPSPPTPAPSAPDAPAPSADPWSGALIEFDGSFVLVKGEIGFGKNHKSIEGDGTRVLDEVAQFLEERPGVTGVEVQSHRHNKMNTGGRNVTQLRADAVRAYLVVKGIDPSRLTAKGYGADMPIDTNRTEDGRRANTRIEFVVRTINGAPTER